MSNPITVPYSTQAGVFSHGDSVFYSLFNSAGVLVTRTAVDGELVVNSVNTGIFIANVTHNDDFVGHLVFDNGDGATFPSLTINLGVNSAALTGIKAKTDNLPSDPASNTQVNTRLATSGYTAPDNTSIATIKAKTDNLPADPASNTQVNTRLATSGYTAPDNTSISAIKTKTDNLPSDPASNTQVNTRLAASSYVAPNNAGIAAILAALPSNLADLVINGGAVVIGGYSAGEDPATIILAAFVENDINSGVVTVHDVLKTEYARTIANITNNHDGTQTLKSADGTKNRAVVRLPGDGSRTLVSKDFS